MGICKTLLQCAQNAEHFLEPVSSPSAMASLAHPCLTFLSSAPYCGGIAQVIDGTYDAVDGILKFISGAARHEYEDERREALEKWGAHVATLVAGVRE
jgi:hypothetical protein